jgi:hypothetical protein
VAVAVALGDAADGLVLGTGDVAPSAGEEVVGEELGADGEQATVRTRSESAAMARRIPRPYVGARHTLTRASERPSGSQDVPRAGIDSPCPAAIVAACIPEEPSSYVSVSAEPKLTPTRSLACHPAAGVFCWREDLRRAGVTSTTDPEGGDRQGEETRDVRQRHGR